MKRIIVSVLLLLITVTSFSQRVDSIQPLMHQMYLEKSKNQKTTGWVMLGSGLLLVRLGAVLSSDTGDDSDWTDLGTAVSGAYIGGIGLIMTVVSVPFFISSAVNKAKRFSTGFKMQRVIGPSGAGLVVHSTPTLSLQLSF